MSAARQVDRAQPLLGTLVSIRVRGHAVTTANLMITAAFAEIAEIHRLMSFHEPGSDISRLNREAAKRAVTVDARTYRVLRQALAMSSQSGGVFDVSVGRILAGWGYLPTAHLPPPPPTGGTWRDIELLPRRRVRFARPLWVDLGGIAKGFAVDSAVECLLQTHAEQLLVNAGGDLRVAGPATERILLRLPSAPADGMVPAIDVHVAALASSSGREHARRIGRRTVGPHIHGKRQEPVGLETFVSVVADRCIVADALTKIVLAKGARSAAILKAYNATAYLHDARDGWRTLGIGH